MAAKKKEHYVNSKEFKEELRVYYDAEEPIPKRVEAVVSEKLLKIATGLSFSPSFINYTWKEEMIGDALVKMYAALKHKKYRFETGSNPFSYFTTIAYNAFINRIKKEKKHCQTIKEYKEKVYEDIITDPKLSEGYVYVKPNSEFTLDGYDS
jgi:DNA-directed RNA polymerase specialized sigma24 family protein